MNIADTMTQAGLYQQTAPRYTSYPAATAFHPGIGADRMEEWLAASDPAKPLSLYLHIPFCERLCWFCACRTQGTRTLGPVSAYLDTLIEEIQLFVQRLLGRRRVLRLHWGGGTPTILSPDQITRLAQALDRAFDLKDAEFSVEIDPTCVDEPKLDALVAAGMSRASLGVQDFSPEVQAAIGRDQSFDLTAGVVDALRARGVGAINLDLVYGLPLQTPDRFAGTMEKLLKIAPSRVALFGYAHVPWMAQRQRMIRDEDLPDPRARHALFTAGTRILCVAGYESIGIDHFAQPKDGLVKAARDGRRRRNFQGYTDDPCDMLIGLGASAVSRLPQGYAQNAAATSTYQDRIRKGQLATHRGFALSDEDRLRARAIEMLMCDFRIDFGLLRHEFGDELSSLDASRQAALARFPGAVLATADAFTIHPDARPLARLIARVFDAHSNSNGIHSAAI